MRKQKIIIRVLSPFVCFGLGLIGALGFFGITQGDPPQGYVSGGLQLLEVTEEIEKEHLEEISAEEQTITDDLLKALWEENERIWKQSVLLEDVRNEQSGYAIITEVYAEGEKLCFEYPQIRGLEDTEKEERINKLIRNELIRRQITNILTDDGSGYIQPDDRVIGNLEYRITLQTDSILSVLYTGLTALERSSMIYGTCYGITIDLEKVSVMELTDLVIIDEAFVKKIKTSQYIYHPAVEEYDDKKQYYYWLLENLERTKEEYILSGLRGEEYNYGYFLMQDNLGIIIGDIDHPIGDYLLVMLENENPLKRD